MSRLFGFAFVLVLLPNVSVAHTWQQRQLMIKNRLVRKSINLDPQHTPHNYPIPKDLVFVKYVEQPVQIGTVLRPGNVREVLKEQNQYNFDKYRVESLFQQLYEDLLSQSIITNRTVSRKEASFVVPDPRKTPKMSPFLNQPVLVKPVDPMRVSTHDAGLLELADHALNQARTAELNGDHKLQGEYTEMARKLAEIYYTLGPDPADADARPETLLGGGSIVVESNRDKVEAILKGR